MGEAAVDEYLAGLPEDQRAALEHLRHTIAAAAPEATEVFTYGMPGFKYRGKPLVSYSAWKNHCALYGQTSSNLTVEELQRYETSKGTIRFKAAVPLPDELVQRLVSTRVATIEADRQRSRKGS